MSADEAALAAALTSRIAEVDGVRRIFPSATSSAVAVEVTGGLLHVSVRLGTARDAPGRAVVGRTVVAVRRVVGSRPLALDLQLASFE